MQQTCLNLAILVKDTSEYLTKFEESFINVTSLKLAQLVYGTHEHENANAFKEVLSSLWNSFRNVALETELAKPIFDSSSELSQEMKSRTSRHIHLPRQQSRSSVSSSQAFSDVPATHESDSLTLQSDSKELNDSCVNADAKESTFTDDIHSPVVHKTALRSSQSAKNLTGLSFDIYSSYFSLVP